jgi:hypothetical protein
MRVDWEIVIKIAVPVITLLLGKYLDRWLAKRPRLVSYLGHASAFALRGNNPGTVHTHAIVVANAGRSAANNVRVGHYVLPDHYQLTPSVPHTVERQDNGASEIVLPKLVPNEQVTISYLYFPPLLWSQIHSYTKSDEGFAKIIHVLPSPQLSKVKLTTIWSLVAIGALAVMYLVVEFVLWVLS